MEREMEISETIQEQKTIPLSKIAHRSGGEGQKTKQTKQQQTKQPTNNNQQTTTNNQQPTTNNQQPTNNNQQTTTNKQQPTTTTNNNNKQTHTPHTTHTHTTNKTTNNNSVGGLEMGEVQKETKHRDCCCFKCKYFPTSFGCKVHKF
jgi:hypothetical protein